MAGGNAPARHPTAPAVVEEVAVRGQGHKNRATREADGWGQSGDALVTPGSGDSRVPRACAQGRVSVALAQETVGSEQWLQSAVRKLAKEQKVRGTPLERSLPASTGGSSPRQLSVGQP